MAHEALLPSRARVEFLQHDSDDLFWVGPCWVSHALNSTWWVRVIVRIYSTCGRPWDAQIKVQRPNITSGVESIM